MSGSRSWRRRPSGSEAADAQIKALKQVLADLEKAKAATFTVKVDGPDARKVKESKEQTRIYLRKLGDEAKASPEAKAKIDKAKARAREDPGRAQFQAEGADGRRTRPGEALGRHSPRSISRSPSPRSWSSTASR